MQPNNTIHICSVGQVGLEISLHLDGVLDGAEPRVEFQPVGDALDFALAVLQLGHDATLIGVIGEDTVGKILRSKLEAVPKLQVHAAPGEEGCCSFPSSSRTSWNFRLLPDARSREDDRPTLLRSTSNISLDHLLEDSFTGIFAGADLVHLIGPFTTSTSRACALPDRDELKEGQIPQFPSVREMLTQQELQMWEALQALIRRIKERGARVSVDLNYLVLSFGLPRALKSPKDLQRFLDGADVVFASEFLVDFAWKGLRKALRPKRADLTATLQAGAPYRLVVVEETPATCSGGTCKPGWLCVKDGEQAQWTPKTATPREKVLFHAALCANWAQGVPLKEAVERAARRAEDLVAARL